MSESDYTLLTGSIYEKDGTLYQQIDGEFTPLRFNTHDGGGQGADGDILNHANVQTCGWEVEESGYRNFCSTVVLPSENFNDDIKWKDGVTEAEIGAIQEWATADLEIADKLCEENLKPMQAEFIEEDFSEWYEEQDDIMTDEEYVEDYLELVHRDERGYIPNFHDDDEIREICRNYLKK